MADSKLKIWLSAYFDGSGFSKLISGIKNVHSNLSKLKQAATETLDVFKGAANIYFAPLKAVAVPAIGAVTTAFGLAIKAMKDWAGQQLGERDIISALIAMGQYTDQYKDKLVGLANTYQESTGIADDFWLKSLGQLTRFGMNAGNVDKVSEALKNLTGLMDGNIDSATDALAKALQGEFSMFSRFGIIVETSGDKIKDLDKLITGINEKGTGLLEARANTLSGKWTALKNQISDTSEAAGKRLAEALNIDSAIDNVKSRFATMMASIQSGGLGDILERAGEALRKKIEAAVQWADKIAEAVQKSGKPLDQVFADALRAAAKVFVDTLGTLLTAGLEIWKAIGVVIFDTLEERALASDWLKGVAIRKANKNFDNATPEQKQQWTDWRTKNPNATSQEFAAHVASGNSDDAVATALTNAMTGIKTAFDGLLEKAKTAVEESVGIKNGDTAATPEKSMITIQGSDGEEITIALEKYITQLSAQNDKLAEAANAGTDSLEASTDAIDAIKTTSDAVKNTADGAAQIVEAADDANTKVEDSLESTGQSLEDAAKSAEEASTAAGDVKTRVQNSLENSGQSLEDAAKSAEEASTAAGDAKTRVQNSLGNSGQSLEDAAIAAEDASKSADEINTKVQNSLGNSGKTLESAAESADAATKAASAAVDAHGKVISALDRSKDASLAAAQAADRNIQLTEQALALIQVLSARFAASEQRLALAESNIRSMRS